MDSLLLATQVGPLAYADVSLELGEVVQTADDPIDWCILYALADISDAIDEIPTAVDPVAAAGILRREILNRFANQDLFGEPIEI